MTDLMLVSPRVMAVAAQPRQAKQRARIGAADHRLHLARHAMAHAFEPARDETETMAQALQRAAECLECVDRMAQPISSGTMPISGIGTGAGVSTRPTATRAHQR